MTAEVAVTLGIGIFGILIPLWASHISNKKEMQRTKRKDTLEAVKEMQREVFDELNTYNKSIILKASQDKECDDYKKLESLLAKCNHFAVAINEDVYDKAFVHRMSGQYLVYAYERLMPMIQAKRGETPGETSEAGRKNNKKFKYYGDFEKLHDELQYQPKK